MIWGFLTWTQGKTPTRDVVSFHFVLRSPARPVFSITEEELLFSDIIFYYLDSKYKHVITDKYQFF